MTGSARNRDLAPTDFTPRCLVNRAIYALGDDGTLIETLGSTGVLVRRAKVVAEIIYSCLLYTSDAADE